MQGFCDAAGSFLVTSQILNGPFSLGNPTCSKMKKQKDEITARLISSICDVGSKRYIMHRIIQLCFTLRQERQMKVSLCNC